MNFESWFGKSHPAIPSQGVSAVVRLLGEEATLPFIARYRKEQTGNLNEVAIQQIMDGKEKWEHLLKRQAFIVKQIQEQGKLTPELQQKVMTSFDFDVLEDLYLPYKKKKTSKAAEAKEAGLEPLADWIWNCGHGTENPQPGQTLEIWAFTFRNEAKGFKEAKDAIRGAQDILTERISEIQSLRQLVRDKAFKKGYLKTGKGEKAKDNSKFQKYFEYQEPVPSLLKAQASHRYLAMRRGWGEKELSLKITSAPNEPPFEEELLKAFLAEACTVPDSPGAAILKKAAEDAYRGHVFPSIEKEVHRELREISEEVAIDVFADNVRTLLLSSPYGPKSVLGIDPGIRTGCKCAVVDSTGKYVESHVLFHASEEEKAKSKALLSELITKHQISALAIGNGTGGREIELFVRASFKELNIPTPVVMVNEAGASVYSASDAAREEFADLDLTIRGAISIARRLQDPLAELVKIDPKSIGVGQYQHDVNQGQLKKSLDRVVDHCVNSVGVNLNTASYHLLAHVSGVGEVLAKNIVTHRAEKGLFKSRQALLEVPQFGAKAFEWAAGFLRVPESDNPLDNTGVHPERYSVIEALSQKLGKSLKELTGSGAAIVKQEKDLAQSVGEFTFNDIVAELEKPGRDPRSAFVSFQYRDDVFELKDLKPGLICPGVVTNVTNFGAFVDIGVHQDGLVHLSQMSDRFVKDPREIAKPGDRVRVRVLEVNLSKNQIALSMKNIMEPHAPPKQTTMPPRPKRPPKNAFKNDAFSVLAALKNKK